MNLVPWNSASGEFAYNWQSKWVGIIGIKTERTQIHFLSDVLTAVASLDLKVPNSELKQRRRRRRRQRERQKRNRYTVAKQQLCTCITLFCTFVCRHCTTTTWKSSKFYVFWRMWTQESDFLSPFLNFHTVFWNSSPGKNCQIANRTRCNKRDKVWSNSNPLLSDVSVAVAIVVGLPNVSWLTTPWPLSTSPSTSPVILHRFVFGWVSCGIPKCKFGAFCFIWPNTSSRP